MTWRDDSIQVIRGSRSKWLELNPVLDEGEIAYEKDTRRLKIGDGSLRYSQLDYIIPEREVKAAIEEAIANLPPPSSGGGGGDDSGALQALTAHIASPTPHAAYDDGPSFLLAYQNAKV